MNLGISFIVAKVGNRWTERRDVLNLLFYSQFTVEHWDLFTIQMRALYFRHDKDVSACLSANKASINGAIGKSQKSNWLARTWSRDIFQQQSRYMIPQHLCISRRDDKRSQLLRTGICRSDTIFPDKNGANQCRHFFYRAAKFPVFCLHVPFVVFRPPLTIMLMAYNHMKASARITEHFFGISKQSFIAPSRSCRLRYAPCERSQTYCSADTF